METLGAVRELTIIHGQEPAAAGGHRMRGER